MALNDGSRDVFREVGLHLESHSLSVKLLSV